MSEKETRTNKLHICFWFFTPEKNFERTGPHVPMGSCVRKQLVAETAEGPKFWRATFNRLSFSAFVIFSIPIKYRGAMPDTRTFPPALFGTPATDVYLIFTWHIRPTRSRRIWSIILCFLPRCASTTYLCTCIRNKLEFLLHIRSRYINVGKQINR